jgi:hypothetical protein
MNPNDPPIDPLPEKPTHVEAQRGEVIDGHRCLCPGCWQTVEHGEPTLREDAEET